MLNWLTANYGSIIVFLILCVIVFFVIRSMVLDRRSGRHSCGGSCAGCSGCSGMTEEQRKRFMELQKKKRKAAKAAQKEERRAAAKGGA
ncbi:MAG: FeoB-associated Cys-rich membrane protein [Lachnospiraceae bacterium]|nr:FeoB-associated Cys-rich membrane protein [Lachnospiraceae bacterium]